MLCVHSNTTFNKTSQVLCKLPYLWPWSLDSSFTLILKKKEKENNKQNYNPTVSTKCIYVSQTRNKQYLCIYMHLLSVIIY